MELSLHLTQGQLRRGKVSLCQAWTRNQSCVYTGSQPHSGSLSCCFQVPLLQFMFSFTSCSLLSDLSLCPCTSFSLLHYLNFHLCSMLLKSISHIFIRYILILSSAIILFFPFLKPFFIFTPKSDVGASSLV